MAVLPNKDKCLDSSCFLDFNGGLFCKLHFKWLGRCYQF
jgi:hypothetical protein